MKHLRRTLGFAIAVAAATLPAALADPNVQHEIARHPAVAVYLPLASGLIAALGRAASERKTTTGGARNVGGVRP